MAKVAKNDNIVTVMIEIPKGSRNKYEYDEKTGRIRFDRMLFSSVHYPVDYGFIPNTLAGDGDAIDAMVILAEPTFPGCFIEARPIGLFLMEDEKGEDEKVLCVPVHDPLWNHVHSLKEVQPHLLKEIEHFFAIYKALESKFTKVKGWTGLKGALKAIKDSHRRYNQNQHNEIFNQ